MRLDFGPYAGQKISEIPTEYLITVLREHPADLLPIVIDCIGMELNMRMHDQLRARMRHAEPNSLSTGPTAALAKCSLESPS
jgi:uncharacterized protein (DUF3820 family)